MNPLSRTGVSFFGFITSATILALALWLEPNPHGVGTHTQLGLQPCVLMSTFGFPCPMCGMTTTFSLMADLRPVAALLNQPLGVFLFASTVAITIVSALEILSPADRWMAIGSHIDSNKVSYLLAFSVLFFGSWFYKIMIMIEISN